MRESVGKVKDLWEYGQEVASREYPPSELALDIEMCELHNTCHFCRIELIPYTSKNGYTYMSNPDKSPHRKSYQCCSSWAEFNGIEDVYTKRG
jgi:hypothetical protein